MLVRQFVGLGFGIEVHGVISSACDLDGPVGNNGRWLLYVKAPSGANRTGFANSLGFKRLARGLHTPFNCRGMASLAGRAVIGISCCQNMSVGRISAAREGER
jgi:hypothetical protein